MEPVAHIPVRVPEAVALKKSAKPIRDWIIRHLPGSSRSSLDRNKLPRAALVWLPHYVVTCSAACERTSGTVTASIEAYSGAPAVYLMHKDVVEAPIEEGEVFLPLITLEEGIDAAKKFLSKSLLRQRGQMNKPLLGDMQDAAIVYFPYWVYYFERRRGLLDIRVSDAARGGSVGIRIRNSIVQAMLDLDEARV